MLIIEAHGVRFVVEIEGSSPQSSSVGTAAHNVRTMLLSLPEASVREMHAACTGGNLAKLLEANELAVLNALPPGKGVAERVRVYARR